MDYREIIYTMVKGSGETMYAVSKRMGKSSNYVSQLMKRPGDTTLDSFLKMCEAMNYEVIVRKQNYLKLLDGEIRVEEDKGR